VGADTLLFPPSRDSLSLDPDEPLPPQPNLFHSEPHSFQSGTTSSPVRKRSEPMLGKVQPSCHERRPVPERAALPPSAASLEPSAVRSRSAEREATRRGGGVPAALMNARSWRLPRIRTSIVEAGSSIS
jgi:hypothetical protein